MKEIQTSTDASTVAAESSSRCLTVVELAKRWRTRPRNIRVMIRTGKLAAITIGRGTKITPQAIADAERGALAVKPRKSQRRELIPPEVLKLLEG